VSYFKEKLWEAYTKMSNEYLCVIGAQVFLTLCIAVVTWFFLGLEVLPYWFKFISVVVALFAVMIYTSRYD
jgi:hypothetical protein